MKRTHLNMVSVFIKKPMYACKDELAALKLMYPDIDDSMINSSFYSNLNPNDKKDVLKADYNPTSRQKRLLEPIGRIVDDLHYAPNSLSQVDRGMAPDGASTEHTQFNVDEMTYRNHKGFRLRLPNTDPGEYTRNTIVAVQELFGNDVYNMAVVTGNNRVDWKKSLANKKELVKNGEVRFDDYPNFDYMNRLAYKPTKQSDVTDLYDDVDGPKLKSSEKGLYDHPCTTLDQTEHSITFVTYEDWDENEQHYLKVRKDGLQYHYPFDDHMFSYETKLGETDCLILDLDKTRESDMTEGGLPYHKAHGRVRNYHDGWQGDLIRNSLEEKTKPIVILHPESIEKRQGFIKGAKPKEKSHTVPNDFELNH